MFFKLFKKNKTNDNNKSYKERILEQKKKNELKEKKRIKQLIDHRLEHMVKGGYIYSSLNPTLKYLNIYSLGTYLEELENLEKYDRVHFKISNLINRDLIEIRIE